MWEDDKNGMKKKNVLRTKEHEKRRLFTFTKTFCNSDDAETLSVLGILILRAFTTTIVKRSAVGR